MSEHEPDKHREVRGYERMLEQLRHQLTDWRAETGPRLRHALASARDHLVELGELSREEADRVADWLRRDVEEAADYTAKTQRDLSDWFRMDLQLIESWLWDKFSSVADETRLDWQRFQASVDEAAHYHTGEIAGPGTLICRACGETLQFVRTGHIPPCPHCRESVFRRPTSGDHPT
jgi:hypothetical protein